MNKSKLISTVTKKIINYHNNTNKANYQWNNYIYNVPQYTYNKKYAYYEHNQPKQYVNKHNLNYNTSKENS